MAEPEIKNEKSISNEQPKAGVAEVKIEGQESAQKKAPPVRKKAKPVKKGPEIVFVKSKRKTAVARASSKSGSGIIRINGFDLNVYEPLQLRRIMIEPINVSRLTQDAAKRMDISINVYGGGQSSQAQAIRSAIAKSIAKSSGSDVVRKEYIRYDRFILIDDSRRVEPKKFKGPKARARFQKSYR